MLFMALEDKDMQAFMEELYFNYERLMFYYAKKYAKNMSDQEDIVQEALIHLISKVDVIYAMPLHVLASYISATVRNVAIDYLRKCAGRPTEISIDSIVDRDTSIVAPQMQSPEDSVILGELKENIQKLWTSIPNEDRVLLEGKYILKYSDHELAKLLHCKSSSIRMKLTRARRRTFERLCKEESIPYDTP